MIIVGGIDEMLCLLLVYGSTVISFMIFKKFKDKKLNANFCVTST